MAVVLVCAGAFVHRQLRTDLDDRVDDDLAVRVEAASRALIALPGTERLDAFAVEGDSFAQAVTPTGALLASSGVTGVTVLTPAEIAAARRGGLRIERRVAGVDGVVRIVARPVTPDPGAAVMVVGQGLQDRDEALDSVVRSFAVGGPVAVLLASMVGYLLAATGLRPVEAMRVRAVAIADGDAAATLPLPAARDEVRRLGVTLNGMLARLRASIDRERRFVADAGHEMRTPVAVIKTELEGVLRTGSYGPDVRDALVAAVEECDNLAQLGEDLLVLARSGDGELPLRREDLEAADVLASVRERFSDRAGHAGRRITARAEGGVRFVADPLRIRQALGNLVDNALRHGGGEIRLEAAAAGGEVVFSVSDAGPGFPAELAPRAFERFSRGEAGRGDGGTGLGLAIVRSIARAHGGTAEIAPGPGAVVRLRIPERPSPG